MAANKRINKGFPTLGEHVAAIFHTMEGQEHVGYFTSLYDSHLVVESVMGRIQQLEAQVKASPSTHSSGSLAANVASLREIVVALKGQLRTVEETLASFIN